MSSSLKERLKICGRYHSSPDNVKPPAKRRCLNEIHVEPLVLSEENNSSTSMEPLDTNCNTTISNFPEHQLEKLTPRATMCINDKFYEPQVTVDSTFIPGKNIKTSVPSDCNGNNSFKTRQVDVININPDINCSGHLDDKSTCLQKSRNTCTNSISKESFPDISNHDKVTDTTQCSIESTRKDSLQKNKHTDHAAATNNSHRFKHEEGVDSSQVDLLKKRLVEKEEELRKLQMVKMYRSKVP